MFLDDRDKIEESKDWLARRRAWIDQREKMFTEQYNFCCPHTNLQRMNDLEIWKFRNEINEWELEEFIKSLDKS